MSTASYQVDQAIGDTDTADVFAALERRSTLSNADCRTIYTKHPLGRVIVDAYTDMIFSVPRRITFDGFPGWLADEYAKVALEMGEDEAIRTTVNTAQIYGDATLYILCDATPEISDPSVPLTSEMIRDCRKVRFAVADPLYATGYVELDPNNYDWLRPVRISVQGVDYHPSRYIMQLNGQVIPLRFSESAYRYSGRSVYQSCVEALRRYLYLDEGLTKYSSQIGMSIWRISPDRKAGLLSNLFGSLGRAGSSAIDAGLTMLRGAGTSNAIALLHDEDYTSIELKGISDLVELRDMTLKEIARATGRSETLLLGRKFAAGLNAGDNDYRDDIMRVNAERARVILPLYDWADRYVLARLLTDDILTRIKYDLVQDGRIADDEVAALLASDAPPSAFRSPVIKAYRGDFRDFLPEIGKEREERQAMAVQTLQAVARLTHDLDAVVDCLNALDLYPVKFEATESAKEALAKAGEGTTVTEAVE